jgi:alanine racemase
MAVVKANAYGHGLVGVAQALDEADAFAVARVEEGLALRRAGIAHPVVLLEGVFDRESLAVAARERFEIVVHSPQQVALLQAFRDGGGPLGVWLKLDSGMNRLGLKGAEFPQAFAALMAMPAVRKPFGLFTHLACADEPQRPATQEQLAQFAAATAGLPGPRSICNSAGLLSFADAQADWVRPGLMLYGVSPIAGSSGADLGLIPAMTLHARVIAIKRLAIGEHVGYSGAWTAARSTLLAVASVGYGDGYPRSLDSGAPVLVNGRRVPLAGRVSMDMIGIDVTDMAAAPCVGDPVVLWGPDLPVEELAARAGTLPYELLCGISQRVGVSIG